MSKTRLILTNCRRCDKPVTTLKKPIHGTREIQGKFGRICSDCITPEEREEIDSLFKSAIQNTFAI